VLKALASELDTDTAVAEVARVLRVPGFKNRKYPDGPEVRVIGTIKSGKSYRSSQFNVSPKADAPKPYRRLLAGDEIPHGTHDNTLHSYAGYLRETKRMETYEEILAELVAHEEQFIGRGGDFFEMCEKHARNICKKSVGGEPGIALLNGVPAGTAAAAPKDAAKVSAAQREYDEALALADQEEAQEHNPYPSEVWQGTPYYDFAELGCENNYIPMEYLINSLMTYVGAVCGHRVVPQFNQELYAHFYTILLSQKGGIGKNESMTWAKSCFDQTLLLVNCGLPYHRKIGAFRSDFGSARGLVESYRLFPNIIQEYAEFTTAIEKFGIQGSGGSFLDFNLNAYDSNEINLSVIKGTKIPMDLPKRINNSIIAGSTTSRWEKQVGSQFETFLQRVNLISTDETRTVMLLTVPNTTPIRDRLIRCIGLLEEYKLIWNLTPEGKTFLQEWYQSLADRALSADDTVDQSEAMGRIQVHVLRLLSHMALWQGELPVVDGKPAEPKYVQFPLVEKSEVPDKIWLVQLGVDAVKKAIAIGEYLIQAKMDHQPPPGDDPRAFVENLIVKWAARYKVARWMELRRRAHLYRYGISDVERCLHNCERIGRIKIRQNPAAPADQRQWMIVYGGGGYVERRGGPRPGSGRPKVK
jgi:RepB DNA-primase from phage plasmid